MGQPTINGLRFKLAFFDWIYGLGDFLVALDELHVKLQLVDRFAAKLRHNLELQVRRGDPLERTRDFVRAENQELVLALDRYGIFYDKYRLSLVRLVHQGSGGELDVEDRYNGPRFVVPVQHIFQTLLEHMFDSSTVQELGLFPLEEQVLTLASQLDQRPGETAKKAMIELYEAARRVQVWVKKEKIASVALLAEGKPVAMSESLDTSDKEQFLNSRVVASVFQQLGIAAGRSS